MALPTDYTAGQSGHVAAHEQVNTEVNRVALIADALPADLAKFIRDTIADTLAQGANVTITRDGAGNTITIAATGGSGGGGGDVDASQIVSGVIEPARLGTGTRDGTKVLRDDGVWSAPGGSGLPPRTRVPGTWFTTDLTIASGTDEGREMKGRAWYLPYTVDAAETYDRIGCRVATSQADTLLRLGIYQATQSGIGSLVYSGVAIDGSIPADVVQTVAITLPAGRYWLAIASTAASGGSLRVRGSSGVLPPAQAAYGAGGLEAPAGGVLWAAGIDVTTGWPASGPTPGGGVAFDFPMVWLRKAS